MCPFLIRHAYSVVALLNAGSRKSLDSFDVFLSQRRPDIMIRSLDRHLRLKAESRPKFGRKKGRRNLRNFNKNCRCLVLSVSGLGSRQFHVLVYIARIVVGIITPRLALRFEYIFIFSLDESEGKPSL